MKKKIVHYDLSKGIQVIGQRVLLWPIDHPDLSNTKAALTSDVTLWDDERIETLHTIYIPGTTQ